VNFAEPLAFSAALGFCLFAALLGHCQLLGMQAAGALSLLVRNTIADPPLAGPHGQKRGSFEEGVTEDLACDIRITWVCTATTHLYMPAFRRDSLFLVTVPCDRLMAIRIPPTVARFKDDASRRRPWRG
jgi:hypothetical protein